MELKSSQSQWPLLNNFKLLAMQCTSESVNIVIGWIIMFTMSVITEKSKEYGMFKDVVFNRNDFRIDALHLTKLRKISANNRKNFDWVRSWLGLQTLKNRANKYANLDVLKSMTKQQKRAFWEKKMFTLMSKWYKQAPLIFCKTMMKILHHLLIQLCESPIT